MDQFVEPYGTISKNWDFQELLDNYLGKFVRIGKKNDRKRLF